MKIWEYVTQNVHTVCETGTLEKVIQLMAEGMFRHVPVVDEVGQLVGMVSDRDVRRLLPTPGSDPAEVDSFIARTFVGDIMTRGLVTVDKDATMLAAVRLSIEHRIGALPVVDGGRLVGIISQMDMLRAYAEYLQLETPDSGLEGDINSPTSFSSNQERPLIAISEPNIAIKDSLSAILRAAGIDVSSFSSLEELTKDQKEGSGTPDLILANATSDPGTDPLETLHTRFPKTPVIVTREGPPRAEAHRKGKGPLFLPCTTETLLGRIRREINLNRWTYDLPRVPTASLSPRVNTMDIDVSVSRQVLVVDQDPLARQMLSYYFRKAGCEVTEAADGHEAISRLALEVFDLVTLELNLPFRTGFEILEFIRRSPDKVPHVVVVSGVRKDEDVVQAFSLGATDYVYKPLRPEVLRRQLRRLLTDEPTP